jgi:stage II sporulation protein AA (anti-sigma F factor antagonist)
MVELKFKEEDSTLIAGLNGEIDHHTAGNLREKIDEAIIVFKPKNIVLDFSLVTFMDSSGVGLVMGRYKTAILYGGKTFVKVKEGRIKKILELSGLKTLIEFIS